ncbi:hypothetical protein [Longibacter sp.]|uniref:hypothetical protein n=1 Tax=Longibacter sp. TaxID=2045415 RepID=UPI003EBF031D
MNGTDRHRIGPAHRRPQNVTDVLCRELGAGHPDGALRQIRTMKRILRTHYRAQKQLERYGVESTMDAASQIDRLRQSVDAERAARRQQARANVETLDAALDVVRVARRRLNEMARTPVTEGGGPEDTAHHSAGPETFPMLRAFDTVLRNLDELRLELWVEAGQPDPGESDASSSIDHLLDRLQEEMERLTDENQSLRDECASLKRQNDGLSARLRDGLDRIAELERKATRDTGRS